MTEYLTIAAPCESSLTEKRSEFIAQLFPLSEEKACMEQLEAVRAKHHKARHHVWAICLRSGTVRASDDGEPQGTGGLPVLGVLQKNSLTDVCCIVTRYFGGVLLGASGLTRAYAGAAALAVAEAKILHFYEAYRVSLTVDYAAYGKISYLLPEFQVSDAGSVFEERVTLRFDVKTELYDSLYARLTECLGGKPDLTLLETRFAEFSQAKG